MNVSLTLVSDLLERTGTDFKWRYSSSVIVEVTSVDRAGDGTTTVHYAMRFNQFTKTGALDARSFLMALEQKLLTPIQPVARPQDLHCMGELIRQYWHGGEA